MSRQVLVVSRQVLVVHRQILLVVGACSSSGRISSSMVIFSSVTKTRGCARVLVPARPRAKAAGAAEAKAAEAAEARSQGCLVRGSRRRGWRLVDRGRGGGLGRQRPVLSLPLGVPGRPERRPEPPTARRGGAGAAPGPCQGRRWGPAEGGGTYRVLRLLVSCSLTNMGLT